MEFLERLLGLDARRVGRDLEGNPGGTAPEIHRREVHLNLVLIPQIWASKNDLQNRDKEVLGDRIYIEPPHSIERSHLMHQTPEIFRNIIEMIVSVH
jgi:hypothetical protein